MSKIKDMKLRYKVAAGVATGAAVIGMAGGAFAYFTSNGSASGTGSVGSNTAWAVSGVTLTGGALYPGQGSNTLSAVVKNPSGGNQGLKVLTVTVNAPTSLNATYASEPTQCSAADFKLTGTGSWVVASDGDSATYTNSTPVDITAGHFVVSDADSSTTGNALPAGLTLSMIDAGYAQDSCQGATINLTVAAS